MQRVRVVDIVRYLKALGWEVDHKISNISAYVNPKDDGDFIYLSIDGTYVAPPLLNKILDKLEKDKEDLDLFMNGKD